jgi:preprotein translocase subunit SecG
MEILIALIIAVAIYNLVELVLMHRETMARLDRHNEGDEKDE